MHLTLQDVLSGKLDAEIEILNYFITLVKLHIWISRKRSLTSHLSAFKEFVKIKFRTVKYLPMKNSIELYFRLDGSRIQNSYQKRNL